MVKNYTSQVQADRSIQHIEKCLVKHGVKSLMRMYDNKKLSGIAFIISVNGKDIPFKMPARIDRIEKQMRKAVLRPRDGTMERIGEQAERTAWRLLSDWIDIQMSLIELDQVELIEVFLPYMYDVSKDETFYEKMKSSGFTLLENKK